MNALPIACSQVAADDPERRVWRLAAAGGTTAIATAIPFVSTCAPIGRAKAAGSPVNLEIPPHRHAGESRILIGDAVAA